MCPSAAIVAAFFILSLSVIRYAAIDDDVFRCWRSTVTPIAQIKPKSSRPTAVTTCCWHLPRPRHWLLCEDLKTKDVIIDLLYLCSFDLTMAVEIYRQTLEAERGKSVPHVGVIYPTSVISAMQFGDLLGSVTQEEAAILLAEEGGPAP